ncbi:unnamed protein product [Schistocephalus solidus]|uniref:BZIP Maf transcription factor n=1 Tax=Schistocephalus solidus TaxID=70667 RepID=A0A0X3NYW6_SCHSO|nr:unnamed protein product [Schistocephalus solidus]
MQPYEYTDEELVHMTTVQLRNLLEQHIISPEQHHEFRSRRRRLQNRKYARRCAKKKQTEVAELTYATQNESSAIKLLRQQLLSLNMSIDRLERQIQHLAKIKNEESLASLPHSLRMLSADGVELGYALVVGNRAAKVEPKETKPVSVVKLSRTLLLPSHSTEGSELTDNTDIPTNSPGQLGRPMTPPGCTNHLGQAPSQQSASACFSLSAGRQPTDIRRTAPALSMLKRTPLLVSPAGGGLTRGGRSLAD